MAFWLTTRGAHCFGADAGQESDDLDLKRGKYPTSVWNQFRILFWSALMQYTRNPGDAARRIMSGVLIGTFTGLIFTNTVGADGKYLISILCIGLTLA